MAHVPTYALYGEQQQNLVPDSLHCESIVQRSSLYDWEIRPHRHDLYVQILYIRSGHCDAVLEDQLYPLDGPCAVFVPTLSVHGFRFAQGVDGVVMTIVTQQMEALLAPTPDIQGCFSAPRTLQLAAAQAARIEQVLDLLLEEFNGNAPWRMRAIESFLKMSFLLLARALSLPASDRSGTTRRSVQHLHRFRILVDQHYRTQRSIGFYARQLGITATQLNRVCRAVLGKSALGTLHDRLIIEAKRDLAYTALSIKEIALTLGFSEPGYFTRFFTQQTGHSPSGFREAALQHLAGEG